MRRLRIRGGRVLTLDPTGAIFDPGEVLIQDGRITSVGPEGTSPTHGDPAREEEVIDARGGVILPGLVDAHAHSSDTLVAGTAPTLPLEAWSLYSDAGRLNRTPREIYLSALLSAIDALKTGTTTFLDHIRLSPTLTVEGLEAAAQAYLDVGIRAVIAPVLSDLPIGETLPLDLVDMPASLATSLRAPRAPWPEQVAACETFIKRWRSRMGVQVGPSAPHRCSDDLLEACGDLRARYGVRLHMHFLETASQAVVARRRFKHGAAAHLAALGLLGRASLVHCIFAEEFDIIAASGACVIHCPNANLRLASGTMDWHRFAARQARLALGADGVLCNDSLSMFSVMKAAGLLHGHGPGAGAEAIVRAAIQGGAKACDFEDLGSLEPGRRADVIVTGPLVSQDPYGALVYGQDGRAIQTVVVDGRVVVRDGVVTTMDEAGVLAEAQAASKRLIARNAAAYGLAFAAAPHLVTLVEKAKEAYARR